MQPHRELPQSARPAEWNAVVMFSLRGEEEGEEGGGGRRKGWEDDRVQVLWADWERREQKRVAAETREGWVTEEWRGRGREGRMKGPTGTGSRRGPTWSRHSAVSHWHLNLRWPGRDCLSGTGDITRGADLWPTTSSSPPQRSPHLLRQPFTSFFRLDVFSAPSPPPFVRNCYPNCLNGDLLLLLYWPCPNVKKLLFFYFVYFFNPSRESLPSI